MAGKRRALFPSIIAASLAQQVTWSNQNTTVETSAVSSSTAKGASLPGPWSPVTTLPTNYFGEDLSTLSQSGATPTTSLIFHTSGPDADATGFPCSVHDNVLYWELEPNNNFRLECYKDRYGGDIPGYGPFDVSDLATCVALCDQHPECVAFSFKPYGRTQPCYLKSVLQPTLSDKSVWGSVKVPRSNSTKHGARILGRHPKLVWPWEPITTTSSSSTSSTASSTTSTAASTTTSATASVTGSSKVTTPSATTGRTTQISVPLHKNPTKPVDSPTVDSTSSYKPNKGSAASPTIVFTSQPGTSTEAVSELGTTRVETNSSTLILYSAVTRYFTPEISGAGQAEITGTAAPAWTWNSSGTLGTGMTKTTGISTLTTPESWINGSNVLAGTSVSMTSDVLASATPESWINGSNVLAGTGASETSGILSSATPESWINGSNVLAGTGATKTSGIFSSATPESWINGSNVFAETGASMTISIFSSATPESWINGSIVLSGTAQSTTISWARFSNATSIWNSSTPIQTVVPTSIAWTANETQPSPLPPYTNYSRPYFPTAKSTRTYFSTRTRTMTYKSIGSHSQKYKTIVHMSTGPTGEVSKFTEYVEAPATSISTSLQTLVVINRVAEYTGPDGQVHVSTSITVQPPPPSESYGPAIATVPSSPSPMTGFTIPKASTRRPKYTSVSRVGTIAPVDITAPTPPVPTLPVLRTPVDLSQCENTEDLAARMFRISIEDVTGKSYSINSRPCHNAGAKFKNWQSVDDVLPKEIQEMFKNDQINFFQADGDYLYYAQLHRKGPVVPILDGDNSYLDAPENPGCAPCFRSSEENVPKCEDKCHPYVKTLSGKEEKYATERWRVNARIGKLNYDCATDTVTRTATRTSTSTRTAKRPSVTIISTETRPPVTLISTTEIPPAIVVSKVTEHPEHPVSLEPVTIVQPDHTVSLVVHKTEIVTKTRHGQTHIVPGPLGPVYTETFAGPTNIVPGPTVTEQQPGQTHIVPGPPGPTFTETLPGSTHIVPGPVVTEEQPGHTHIVPGPPGSVYTDTLQGPTQIVPGSIYTETQQGPTQIIPGSVYTETKPGPTQVVPGPVNTEILTTTVGGVEHTWTTTTITTPAPEETSLASDSISGIRTTSKSGDKSASSTTKQNPTSTKPSRFSHTRGPSSAAASVEVSVSMLTVVAFAMWALIV